jgi:hypothetical protein
MTIGDLLFYHRSLRRLVAIELKLGSFDATYKGQMELYLRWLDRYERRPGEEPPIGLILCGEKKPRADRATTARPWRDQGGGVSGGAAAQGDAGGQAARGHAAGERAGE